MPSNCLMFVLTGVFIACRLTTSNPLRKPLNEEIQNDLDKLIEQCPVAQNLNTTNFRIPVFKKERCAVLRLKAFIKLLDPVKIEDEKGLLYHQFYHKLQDFDSLLSLQKPERIQKCETEEYQHRGFKEILKDLKRVMQHLYCLQGHCN